MANEVDSYVSSCLTYKESKAPNKILRPPMGKQHRVDLPWQRIYVDLLGLYPRSKMGNTTILIVLDQLTKVVLLKPLRTASTDSFTAYPRHEVFHVYGVPETLHSDNGKQFIGHQMTALLNEYNAIYSPQANVSERVNRTILAAIRAYLKDEKYHRSWDRRDRKRCPAQRTAVPFMPCLAGIPFFMLPHTKSLGSWER